MSTSSEAVTHLVRDVAAAVEDKLAHLIDTGQLRGQDLGVVIERMTASAVDAATSEAQRSVGHGSPIADA